MLIQIRLVDLREIESLSPQCECGVLPLYYRPWSGWGESDSHYGLPKPAYYHYTTPRLALRSFSEGGLLHKILLFDGFVFRGLNAIHLLFRLLCEFPKFFV